MISFRLGKQSHVYKLVETVVICFQILTFAVSATATTNELLQEISCDLLSNSYLCSICDSAGPPFQAGVLL